MRRLVFSLLFVLSIAPVPAMAAPPTSPPAKPAASLPAIIPGSPLATLTGASAPPASAEENTPSPFGTETLGLAVSDLISQEATSTVVGFLAALQRSTALTPVWQWLAGFARDSLRQQHAIQILQGLILSVAPAIILEAVLRLALTRPRNALVKRAAGILGAEQAASEGENGLAAAEAGEVEPSRKRWRESLSGLARTLWLAILHLLLRLVPLVGFVVADGSLLTAALIKARDARLAVVGISNAYLACRLALEMLRFFIAPWAAPLRLVSLTDQQAIRANRWAQILLTTGAVSYGVVSVPEILGLPKPGAMALTRILVLIMHVELAVMIWKSRKVVARWIRGVPTRANLAASSRQRLAAIWHYLALFYVMALWVAWAGGVQNAFAVLLRVVLFFLAALTLGRLAWAASEAILERLFPDPKTRKLRHPRLVDRARAYNPLIKALIRAVIAAGVVTVILLGWGVNLMPLLLGNPIIRALLSATASVIIIIAAALIVWEILNALLDGRIEKLTSLGKIRQALRLRTLAPMLRASFGTAIGLLAGLICLSRIGVNAAPLLAGAGVLGIAIGFGSQKLVQDIITGLFLLTEDTMQVGDVVTLAGMSGTVERLSIRTIRLRGGDGSMNIIPFSAVTTVTNQTRDFGYAQISVGVGYKEDLDRVCALLTEIAHDMRQDPTWGSMMRDDLQLNGLDEFGSNALIITGQIRTGPGQHWSVRREFSRRVVQRFAAEAIEIPYSSSVSTLVLDPDELDKILGQISRESKANGTIAHDGPAAS